MDSVKVSLSRDIDMIELHTLADLHIGDAHCDYNLIERRIEYIKNTPNAYCIINGDICDNATKTSIGDTYAQVFNPMAQIEKAVSLFTPIKDKILGISFGNHEARSYNKEGINITKIMAAQLGLLDKYTDSGAVLFLRFGVAPGGRKETNGSGKIRKICYTIYFTHGRGGGRKEGAKAIRLADMASIVDADVYIHSHTHLPLTFKQDYFRVDPRNSKISQITKLFVNTSAMLNYGGYGQVNEFKPSSKDCPIIYLSGRRKKAEVLL